jgi:hypothetical protein
MDQAVNRLMMDAAQRIGDSLPPEPCVLRRHVGIVRAVVHTGYHKPVRWSGEGGNTVSEPGAREPASNGATLERAREAVLAAARPLPPAEEMLIEDLTEDEERLFVEAILDA